MKLHSFNIETVQKVGSTNLLMRDREQSGRLKHGDVLRAIFQNEGLGQSGNMWESETGKNLTFSMFLETNFIKAEDVFILNKIISLALWTYLNDRNVQELKIKWPNDIYVGENKIAEHVSGDGTVTPINETIMCIFIHLFFICFFVP